jgi:hypothetical protein
VVRNREGDDFMTNLVTFAYAQDTLLAQVNRTALIMALETHFGCVQIFSDELAFAKYCQKEWPAQRMEVVANIICKRGFTQGSRQRIKVYPYEQAQLQTKRALFAKAISHHVTTCRQVKMCRRLTNVHAVFARCIGGHRSGRR